MEKILVIDDDFEQRDLYVSLFTENGMKVLSAKDGLEGLEIALKERPSAIFTGIIMPRMDGFEMIRQLRNNATTAEIPVIMFSHLGREEDKEKAAKLPRVEFMIKGYDTPKTILERIKHLVNTTHSHSTHVAPQSDNMPHQPMV